LGIGYTNRSFENDPYPAFTFGEESLLRPTLQMTAAIAPALSLEAGGEMSYSSLYEEWFPGYHAQITYTPDKIHSIYAGIRNGRGQPQFSGSYRDHYQSDNYELGWMCSWKNQHVSLAVYYQRMSRLLAAYLVLTPSEYDLMYLADYPYISGDLIFGSTSTGVSRHLGIEASWGYTSENGWRFSFNQAVYKSERGLAAGTLESGRYDGRFATHFLVSREVIREKEGKNRIWNFSLRGLLHGGLWEPQINVSQSGLEEETIYVYPAKFDQQLPLFKRLDAGISRTIAYEKVRWRYSLDIQNLAGLTNVSYRYYDPFLGSVEDQNHLGLIPVLSVQASW
jgi:hypothetical protein